MDQSEIERKLQELDQLKTKVEKLIGLSQLGQDVRNELDRKSVV